MVYTICSYFIGQVTYFRSIPLYNLQSLAPFPTFRLISLHRGWTSACLHILMLFSSVVKMKACTPKRRKISQKLQIIYLFHSLIIVCLRFVDYPRMYAFLMSLPLVYTCTSIFLDLLRFIISAWIRTGWSCSSLKRSHALCGN